jgi:hypothetical protein
MTEADHEYFIRRAAEERAAAEGTEHPAAKRSHEERAHRYEVAAAAMLGLPVVQLNVGAASGARPR